MDTSRVLSALTQATRHIKEMQFEKNLLIKQASLLETEVEDLKDKIDELESELEDAENLQSLGRPIGDLDDLVLAVDYARRKQWNNAAFYLARAIPDLDFTHLFEVKP